MGNVGEHERDRKQISLVKSDQQAEVAQNSATTQLFNVNFQAPWLGPSPVLNPSSATVSNAIEFVHRFAIRSLQPLCRVPYPALRYLGLVTLRFFSLSENLRISKYKIFGVCSVAPIMYCQSQKCKVLEIRELSFLDSWILERLSSLEYQGTSTRLEKRGVHLTGIYF